MTRTYLTKDAQIHQLQRQVEDLKKDKAELVEKCKALLAESLRYKQRYDSSQPKNTVTGLCEGCEGYGAVINNHRVVLEKCPVCCGSGLPLVEKGVRSEPPRSVLKWP